MLMLAYEEGWAGQSEQLDDVEPSWLSDVPRQVKPGHHECATSRMMAPAVMLCPYRH